MAISLVRLGLRSIAANLERQAVVLSAPICSNVSNEFNWVHNSDSLARGMLRRECGVVGSPSALFPRRYSERRGPPRPERDRHSDSDSDSDSGADTECKGLDRSMFWRRKMRTVHNILDVDKDGLISYNDFLLFAERFKSRGHLDDHQANEFTNIMKVTWEEQWGAVDPYNFVTVEQYLEDMHHVLNDAALKKKALRWLPYLFKAVDADPDRSGFISVKEFKLFFECLGLSHEHAAIAFAFALIDTNSDGKVSLKEFVRLGKEFFFTEDESRGRVSKMFWGPLALVDH